MATSSLAALTKDVGVLAKKQRSSAKKNAAAVSGLLKHINACRTALSNANGNSEARAAAIGNLKRRVAKAKPLAAVKGQHKVLHQALAKAGKTIDKTFQGNPDSICRPGAADATTILFAIGDHLYRRGRFDVADAVLAHTKRSTTAYLRKEPFVAIYRILSDFRRGDFHSALAWAHRNRDALETIRSGVEFELHKLEFVKILQRPRDPTAALEAVAYSRKHFSRFADTHMKEIGRLMGALLYAGQLESSPYADLVSPDRFAAVERMLIQDNCVLQGMAQVSPLETSVKAGFIALPTLLKLQNVMAATGTDMQSLSTLPAEIELDDDMYYHSVFACPVTREQARDGNPAMLLKCGHVICKESLEQLASGRSSRFKCPTCPVVQTQSEALRLYL